MFPWRFLVSIHIKIKFGHIRLYFKRKNNYGYAMDVQKRFERNMLK